MNLKVKRLTESAKLPEKAFPTEAGFEIVEADELSESDRGENGFGSTGV